MSSSGATASEADASTSATTPAPSTPQLECDYDLNPSILYQAIEAKQWEYAISLFDDNNTGKQSSTWVVRKETNGKLRWRLLPIHAAVIFGSPMQLIELLLTEYPLGAQAKDDQGMLPLHLAFRQESSWEVIEELLTAYPLAIHVKDRKGRTPLQCGNRSSSSSSASSVHSKPKKTKEQSKAFKTIVSVVDMCMQVAIAGEKQKAVQDSRSLLEGRLEQLQDSHLATLTDLRKEWQTQAEESKSTIKKLHDENKKMKQQLQAQQIDMSVSRATQKDLAEKLSSTKMALQVANNKEMLNSQLEHVKKTNSNLRRIVEDLVSAQQDYHAKFNGLLEINKQLNEERSAILKTFQKNSEETELKEYEVQKDLKKWLSERQKSLEHSQFDYDEEKKVEGVLDFVDRLTSSPTRVATTDQHPVIDLSMVSSKGSMDP